VERATIITTMPLTDTLRQRFKSIVMKNTTGKSVELEEKIDPKLIGGYILRVGDQQIDGSIRSQLNDIRLQFLN
jgi:F-type H+-transporting ATPase subunit delta